MSVQPIPDGFHTATPYLIVSDADRAINFYRRAFSASVMMEMLGADDKVLHAEIMIGNSPIMIGNEVPALGYLGPHSLGGTPVSIVLYVEDVDAVFQQALVAGAEVRRPLANQFYGDRTGTVCDPFGHLWSIATHREDVSPEEMERRMKEGTHG